MKKITLLLALFSVMIGYSQNDSVTFQVDMNNYTGTFTTVYVNSTFNAWCGSCNPLSDADSNGVWEVTLPLTADTIEFKYTLDGWTVQENLTSGLSCTKTSGPNTNRELIFTSDTVLPVVCWESCSPCGASSSHNITFQVDMSTYTGSFTTPEVNGEFNGWCGNCAPMADPDGDDIWEIVVPVTADSIEYKFSHDNWGGQESLTPGTPCTKTTSGFTNRFMHVTKDTVLPAVCWESCVTCGGAPISADVTFQLDLSDYTGSYTDVNINGTFNGWCGNCAKMTDIDGDSIYEITINVPTDTIEFKYTLDGWAIQESLTPGASCTKTTSDSTGTFTNRYLVPSGDTTLPAVCWNECVACNLISVNEYDWLKNLSIHPNPSSGVINIRAQLEVAEHIALQVFDTQGRMVYNETIEDSQIDSMIDLSGMSNGLYMINIMSDRGQITEKVMISK